MPTPNYRWSELEYDPKRPERAEIAVRAPRRSQSWTAPLWGAGVAVVAMFLIFLFWPEIAAFWTPFKRAFLYGTFFGACVGLIVLGLFSRPCEPHP